MKFKIMAILMVGLLLLNGCGKASEIPAKTALSTPKSTMKTLTIYSIDSDTMSLIPVVVKKEEKTLTAEYITYLVTQNLEDEDVRVDHVEQQKNVVVVSFDSKAKPVKRCSKQMETLILNCFASSLLDLMKFMHRHKYIGEENEKSNHNRWRSCRHDGGDSKCLMWM